EQAPARLIHGHRGSARLARKPIHTSARKKNRERVYMLRTLLALTLSLAAISIPAAATGAPNANVTLTGVVGPGFNISLKNADGTSVSDLDPGTYDISVTDNSIDHNFHLRGPGVDMSTELEFIGTA